MTTLTPAQVRHIAKLARLKLSDGEVDKFSKELTSILQYVDMLTEVDTSLVQATAQVTGQTNVFRCDEIRAKSALHEALLSCSPLPQTDHQIVSPSAHG